MTEPDNIILQQLRLIRSELAEFREQHLADMREIKNRLLAVEQQIVGLHLDAAAVRDRLARVETRLDRIETRLGLIETPA